MPTFFHAASCASTSAVRSGIRAVRRLAARAARARHASRARAELHRLDAAALRDLGLSRSDLASLLAGADCRSGDSDWRLR